MPLRSFAQALRPGGWVVLSLDHPFGPPLKTQRGGYFDTELVSDTWTLIDVAVGMAAGTALGIGIPYLHERNKHSTVRITPEFSPDSAQLVFQKNF